MADENPTLRESIEKAGAEQGNTDQNQSPESQTQAQVENKTESTTEETPKIDPEIEEAVNFYKALRDPRQQREIINELALRAGLIKPEQTVSKEQEKNYGEVIEEILGQEYPDLKDKLGVIFKAFEKQADSKYQTLVTEIARERSERMINDFDSEFQAFLKANNVTEEIAGKMNKEIAVLPPSTGKSGNKITLTEYLTKIHKLVMANEKQAVSTTQRVERINQNLKERPTNLSSDIGDERLKRGSKLPSIKEAILAASQGITFDE